MTQKPRIFVSSVVERFSDFREAARAGIIEAGGTPVLVNEDFPALSMSSRNACLDAVDSCDVYLGIVGERGGGVAPSGKLVVEEEYERAKLRKLPTIFLLQDIPRDPQAQRFARRVSDYVDGAFRRTFKTPGELRQAVVQALTPHLFGNPAVSTPPDEVIRAFRTQSRMEGTEPTLRAVIAPERREEVVDPVRISSVEFVRQLMELGHRGEVPLLTYAHGKEHSVEADSLVIRQAAPGRGYASAPDVRLAFSEKGILSADVLLGRRGQAIGSDLLGGMVLAIEDVAEALRAVMAFYAGVIGALDLYMRHQRFFYNVALLDLGHRTLEKNPQPRSSYTLSMRSGQGPIVAFEEPRIVSRQDLQESAAEIERVTTLLSRKASS